MGRVKGYTRKVGKKTIRIKGYLRGRSKAERGGIGQPLSKVKTPLDRVPTVI